MFRSRIEPLLEMSLIPACFDDLIIVDYYMFFRMTPTDTCELLQLGVHMYAHCTSIVDY